MSVKLVVSIPTLIGSLCSFTASLSILICYAIIPRQRHFRHALILNLLIADLLNSLNNAVSGIIVLTNNGRMLQPGLGCNLNGWLGQLTVQTVDFSIIAISVVVLLTVKSTHVISQTPTWKKVLLCIATWIPGIITSFTALGLHFYGPVSGNWCWIRSDLLLERWTLTHGWRVAIFFTTIGIYVSIYVILSRVYGTWNIASTGMSGNHTGASQVRSRNDVELQEQNTRNVTVTVNDCENGQGQQVGQAQAPSSKISFPPPKAQQPSWESQGKASVPQLSTNETVLRSRRREIRSILLLNGYPIMYIILWTPGILNRVVESTRGKSPLWLTVLQSSTQFIGLANALTYGWNEGLRQQIVLQWQNWRLKQYRKSS